MASLPTGTVTFLFSDIEGSTTLLQRLGDRRYAEVEEEHRRLLHTAFAEARPNNLPIQLTSFIGRVREMAEVKTLIGIARLVTLTGSARAAAVFSHERFPAWGHIVSAGGGFRWERDW
jgi:class 3 adenylate cyclase